MKVVVFGATGQTGLPVCRQALQAGHQVSAFGRSADKLKAIDRRITAVQGDVLDADAVAAALKQQQAAIVCMGSVGLGDKTTLRTGTGHILAALKQQQSSRRPFRLVVLSAAGVAESRSQISWLTRLFIAVLLRNIYADHLAQEQLVQASSALNWTIVRAAVLNNKPPTGKHAAGNDLPIKQITRQDLASFLVAQLKDPTYSKQAVSVTQG